MSDRELVVQNGNVWPGLALCALGLGALWLGIGYGPGSWMNVGAGAFPILVSLILIGCGLLIALEDLLGHRVPVSFPIGALRAGAGLLGAIAIFALTIERLGLVPASALCALLVSLSARTIRWSHVLGLVIVLPLASWAIFTLSLGLQAPAFVWSR